MINVLLVDDHHLVRTGISQILSNVRGFSVVGECQTGEEALKFCRNNTPDIVLMDMDMPGMGGLEATKKILRIAPEIKIIVLSGHTEDAFVTQVMKLGASGYLTKGASPDEMVNAIRAVHCGQRYLPPDIAQKMALRQFNSEDENPFSELSEREMQIMMMITRGDKVTNISGLLNLSGKTVNSYRYRMFEKLAVSNDVELTHLAILHGMLKKETL